MKMLLFKSFLVTLLAFVIFGISILLLWFLMETFGVLGIIVLLGSIVFMIIWAILYAAAVEKLEGKVES